MKRRAHQALAGMVPLSAAAATYWGVGLAVLPPARWVFSTRVLYQVHTDRLMIALTFDDGPNPAYIGRFLDALGEARATFFVLGENVRRWPSLTRDISSAGHEVACHGDV